jgi:hypothetical protein
LDTLDREFTYTFGGCTIIRGLDGSYLSHAGFMIPDRVNIIFTDADLSLQHRADVISRYAERLEAVVNGALSEETVLIVVFQVFHAG